MICDVIRKEKLIPVQRSFQAVAHGLIPIPSRLGFEEPDPATPLAGKRIAVKDIFDLKGVKTTLCSKAYEELTDEARTTATCIQRLIDLGAVIVGKVKTSPFASGMGPRDWVDVQPPFNPRGDGYLDPGCSSAGSGAAIAGYDWLDVAIGSDTLGSMVGPACNNGIFGLRPSHGLLTCEGALPVCPPLDTPGNFSRDISELSEFTRLWMNGSPSDVELKIPTKLVVPPERFTRFVPEVANAMEEFIQQFEKVTGVTRTAVTMEDLWAFRRPSKFAGKSFQDTFGTVSLQIISVMCGAKKNRHWHIFNCTGITKTQSSIVKTTNRNSGESCMLSRYSATNGMIRPSNLWFVLILTEFRDLGAKLTSLQYAEALAEKDLFADFVRKHVFDNGSVMLLPCSANDVAYRDTYDGTVEECARRWQGFDIPETAFSALGGGPALAFPAGHRPYESKITKVKEYQPVGLMLLSAPGMLDGCVEVKMKANMSFLGTDHHLIELLKYVLVESKLPTSVETGRLMY
ncbi:hypothetical protein CJF30_00004699 [Rutstroemia sp. NJR-2017a BBW]|nr:hypothetical protein CJF30_00004699 [Rutstroemia sp. NJR-2017a BBW]